MLDFSVGCIFWSFNANKRTISNEIAGETSQNHVNLIKRAYEKCKIARMRAAERFVRNKNVPGWSLFGTLPHRQMVCVLEMTSTEYTWISHAFMIKQKHIYAENKCSANNSFPLNSTNVVTIVTIHFNAHNLNSGQRMNFFLSRNQFILI